jgi:hypothetical protein
MAYRARILQDIGETEEALAIFEQVREDCGKLGLRTVLLQIDHEQGKYYIVPGNNAEIMATIELLKLKPDTLNGDWVRALAREIKLRIVNNPVDSIQNDVANIEFLDENILQHK